MCQEAQGRRGAYFVSAADILFTPLIAYERKNVSDLTICTHGFVSVFFLHGKCPCTLLQYLADPHVRNIVAWKSRFKNFATTIESERDQLRHRNKQVLPKELTCDWSGIVTYLLAEKLLAGGLQCHCLSIDHLQEKKNDACHAQQYETGTLDKTNHRVLLP